MSATTPSVTSPLKGATPITLSIEPMPSPVDIHIEPVKGPGKGRYQVYARDSSGELYTISLNLSEEKQREFDELCSQENATGSTTFVLKLNDLIRSVDGNEIDIAEDNEGYARFEKIRELVRESVSPHLVFKKIPSGQRASITEAPSFQRTSERLKKLKFTDAHLKKAIESAPLAEKLQQMKRRTAAGKLLVASRAILDQQMLGVPKGESDTSTRVQRLNGLKIGLADESFEALLSFEAANPVDFAGADPKKQLEEKQKKALEWIQGNAVPTLTWTESFQQKQWSNKVDAAEEAQFAKDLARLSCRDRKEYRLLTDDARRDGQEVFYARLIEAVAEGKADAIETVINGPLFDLALGQLHAKDQLECRTALKKAATGIAEKLAKFQVDGDRVKFDDALSIQNDEELIGNYLHATEVI